jgi:hypothetical protein
MNSVAAKENLLKQVSLVALNVFLTRFLYQAANSFADVELPNRLVEDKYRLHHCRNRLEALRGAKTEYRRSVEC